MDNSTYDTTSVGQTPTGARAVTPLRGSSTKTRKSAETRQRIMDAASELMVERGSTDFQMSEVSAKCHMSKGALYYYFADREELIHAVFAEVIERSITAAEEVVAKTETAEEALHALCIDFSKQLQSGSTLALAVTYEYSSARVDMVSFVENHFARAAALISEQMERAKEEGVIRKDVQTKLAATFLVGGYVMTSLGVSRQGLDVNGEELAEEIYKLGMHGLALPRSE